MRPDGIGEHESACHFAEPLNVVHAEPEQLQHHFREREDPTDDGSAPPAGTPSGDSPFEGHYVDEGVEPGLGDAGNRP
jgi:hypothetical protein